MPELSSQSVGELLIRWRAGDQEALQVLIAVVYREPHPIFQCHLQQERPEHTLQSAALVNEAYPRLVKQRPAEIENPRHFLAVARPMRQIQVDHARGRRAVKRDARCKIELSEQTRRSRASIWIWLL